MPFDVLEEEKTAPAPVVFAYPQEGQRSATFDKNNAKKKINWVTTLFMVAFHIGAVAALFMFSWTALIVSVVLYFLSLIHIYSSGSQVPNSRKAFSPA